MPNPPRLTAADAETLLVSAGFQYLQRRGHHRIYGRGRTRVVVPFDGSAALHPKAVRMLVQSIDRSRPVPSFEIDENLVGLSDGVPPSMETESLKLDGPPAVAPVRVTRPAPPPRRAPPPPAMQPTPPVPMPPLAAAQVQIAPAAVPPPAAPANPPGEEDIELPRPKPKGAWS